MLLIFVFYAKPLLAQHTMDTLVTERIQWIQKTLNKDKASTQRWWYGWVAGYSAATIGQGTIALLSDSKSTRQDMILGASSTSLGLIGQFISPVSPNNVSDSLASIYDKTPQDRLIKLQLAEDLLKEAAFTEKDARSWKIHALCGVVNMGCGLITWIGFKRTVWDGALIFTLNMAVSEVQIHTQPARAMKRYREYCKKYKPEEKRYACKTDVKLLVGISPVAVQIRLVF